MTAVSATEHVHFVTVEHTYTGFENDGVPEVDATTIRFECRALPTDPCRNYPNEECEEWAPCADHPDVPQDECYVQSWFDAGYDAAMYLNTDGDVEEWEGNIPAGSGPIEVEYDDGITWSWVPEPVAMTLEQVTDGAL